MIYDFPCRHLNPLKSDFPKEKYVSNSQKRKTDPDNASQWVLINML